MAPNKDEIINTIKALIDKLNKENIPIDKAILFGSYVRGEQTEYSDIDVALVSDAFEGIRFLDKQKINPYLINFDSRLEIHPYRTGDFNEENLWFVKEIIDTGIVIV